VSRVPEILPLRSAKMAFLGVALLSAVVNVLHLAGSVFMLEVYDRVLPSRSIPTLVGLSVILVMVYAFQALFDILRGRILSRIGVSIDEALAMDTFRALVARPLAGKPDGDGQQPLRDLDQVKTFLAGAGPSALFDLPWMPLYLAVCFAFHPLLGLTALAGGILLVISTLATEIMTRRRANEGLAAMQARNAVTASGQRNAEVVRAMGMADRLGAEWSKSHERYVVNQQATSDVAGGFGAFSKVVRLLIQSAVLGVGAYLVIGGEVTSGVMIASSILASRSLAPVEQAIANWKGFVGARNGWKRIKAEQANRAVKREAMALPPPERLLAVEALGGGAPGTNRVLVDGVDMRLQAGEGLGIIGPSASGKSSLARLLVGIWPAWRGQVRLDGASLDNWSPETLGRHIGYLPQDVELFAGTVAQNISRFELEPPPEAVIAAAKAADIHDMILRLENGYDTQIGEAGSVLSGGQKQRLALARALYGDPFLVVLDEPNSNLDNEGDHALTHALKSIRERGGIVVVIAHRPSALAGVDRVMVMAGGQVRDQGPKDEVLGRLMRPVAEDGKRVAEPGLSVVSGGI
jgi:PrtD family type I secretion system ABC transporter